MARGIRIVGAGVSADEKEQSALPPAPKRKLAAGGRGVLSGLARPKKAAKKTAAVAAKGGTNKETAKEAARPAAPPAKPARSGTKLWSGRLGQTARLVEEFTTSIAIDRRLYAEDIEGSQAHAAMLRSIGILSATEWRALDAGLRAVRREFDRDEFAVDPGDEDIHSAVERRLREICGDVAAKLHTGRSRNDQIATDLRLYAKRVCRELMLGIADLQQALLRRAGDHRGTLLPGYTHGQRAQVVSLAHHLLAYVEMLQRDGERLMGAHERCDVLPLGAGALAGSTLPLDRALVAATLDFESVSGNSLDAVSDRDFVAEIIFACALTMVHLSRLGEELVMWSSTEYGFVELPDAYATGSSLMPQKKNPDVLELTRGRTGRVIGDLVAILTTIKGLPLAYNRDLQEDKPPFFDAVDTTAAALHILAELMGVIEFDVARMREAASDPALVATDIAEYLVRKNVPFREAHGIVGRTVRQVRQRRRTLADLSAADWKAIDPHFEADVLELFDIDKRLRRREIAGGPGPRSVSKQLVRMGTLVAKTRRAVTVLAREAKSAREVGAAKRRTP